MTPKLAQLSRREREIMQALYSLDEAGAADVARHLGDEGGYDSIRVTMGILKRKGYVKHKRDGRRFLYRPKVSIAQARRSAMDELTHTYFKGCPTRATLAFLESSSERMTLEDLDEVAALIERTVRARD